MRTKTRLVLRYAALGVVCIGACIAGALVLLDRNEKVPDEGLVPGLTDSLAHSLPSRAPELRFTRVPLPFRHFPGQRTHRLPEDMGSGVACADLDGDGRLDLFFVNLAPLGADLLPCELYRNLGDFRFERVDTKLPALQGNGVAAGDYDADGDFDLYVTGYGRNVLLRNDGGMVFVDVTKEAGVAGGGYSTGACWGDADGDGDLDLYVCRYVEFDESAEVRESRRGSSSLPVTLNPSAFPAQTNLLFLNEGGRFREAAKERGVNNPGGKSLGAVFADLDEDGVIDIYVANDVSDNALYRGLGGGRFEDVTHPSCTADWRGAMGLALGDPDNDGDLDLFITHWLPEENTLYVKEKDQLFFSDGAVQSLLGPPSRGLIGWSCDFADLDCDGWPDLVVVNGSTFERPAAKTLLVPMPVQLFWNDGRRFFDLAARSGPALQAPVVGRGGCSGDLDDDGDLDLVLTVHGGEPLLLRNDTEVMGNRLTIVVRGSQPNVFAYGARVTVESQGRTQLQQVGAKVTYLSSGTHALHFGLGAATAADRVVVRFPSGKQIVRKKVPANTTLLVKEVDPRTLGPLMDKARDAAGPQAARAVYMAILKLDPMHRGALYNLALLSEPEEALRLCLVLLRVEPMAQRGHMLRARILSDPSRPKLMDLDTAAKEIAEVRRLNRDETGGLLELGRIQLLGGDPKKAAATLEKVKANPRAAALAALCHYRAGNPAEAKRLLEMHTGKPKIKGLVEEGDTAGKTMGARDLLARLLALPVAGEPTEGEPNVDVSAVAPIRYEFKRAAQWALDPPARTDDPPPATSASWKGDLDGDGDEDLVVACGCDPAAPLPWWTLYREADGYRPVRGKLPGPGFFVTAVAVSEGNVYLRGAANDWFKAGR